MDSIFLNFLSTLLKDSLNKSLDPKLFNFIIIIFKEYSTIKLKKLTSEEKTSEEKTSEEKTVVEEVLDSEKISDNDKDSDNHEDSYNDEDLYTDEDSDDEEEKNDEKYLQIVQKFIDELHKNLTTNTIKKLTTRKFTQKQRLAYMELDNYYKHCNSRDIYNAKINDIIAILIVQLNYQFKSFNNIRNYANVNNTITIKNQYNNKEYNINLTEYLYTWYNLYFINKN